MDKSTQFPESSLTRVEWEELIKQCLRVLKNS